MRELSVSAVTGTLSYADRMASQLEINSLKSEIDRISGSAQLDKKRLLDGSASALWSSGSLSVKAIINGMTKSGEYDVRVSALKAGKGEAQNSGIFKIAGPDVLTNVSLNSAAGFNDVSVKGAPPGEICHQRRTGKFVQQRIESLIEIYSDIYRDNR
jgi:flagellin